MSVAFSQRCRPISSHSVFDLTLTNDCAPGTGGRGPASCAEAQAIDAGVDILGAVPSRGAVLGVQIQLSSHVAAYSRKPNVSFDFLYPARVHNELPSQVRQNRFAACRRRLKRCGVALKASTTDPEKVPMHRSRQFQKFLVYSARRPAV